MKPIFISGIGTGIGKTVVAALLTEAMQADYWKPVQAGFESGTDSMMVSSLISNSKTNIYPESYKLQFAASPHISAARENLRIDISSLVRDFNRIKSSRQLIIEGAGGLLVPLNETEFVVDLVKALDAVLVLVSRNYLGSINHSLMSAALCKSRGLDVAGWVFNDDYLDYADEIAGWSGYPVLFSLPHLDQITGDTMARAARGIDLSYLYTRL